ncbi:hypothetical protein ABZ766_03380 [Streptomyces sp. NPDC006670]|uniref:hypothetical protein n=1 Tax=Streptomyces sp. NPDC006670 TaxID=3154476 RepID=UPI0033E77A7D
MTVSFGLLRGAESRYGNRSCGGSVLGLANSLHAQLYGLPLEPPPLPGALDELLQATGHDADQNLVLDQVATQLEAAAALIQRARHQAHWQQLPKTVAAQLASSQALAQHLSTELHQLAPAFAPAGAPPAPKTALPVPAPAAAPGRARP